jgi:hypothetical protein
LEKKFGNILQNYVNIPKQSEQYCKKTLEPSEDGTSTSAAKVEAKQKQIEQGNTF